MTTALQIIAFQAVWLACALGASAGTNWPGVAAASALVTWHLVTSNNAARAAVPLVAAGLLGALTESALVLTGLIAFNAAIAPWPVPPWIIALWIAFATTLPVLGPIVGPSAASSWPWAAGALGLIAGPIAYIAGERLGALTPAPGHPGQWWIAIAAIAVIWAIATPLLLAVEARWGRPRTPTG